MEHCPISVKLEDVPSVQISGVSCSTEGVMFLSDRNRSLIYRLDIEDGTSFSFGKAALSRSMQTFFPLEDLFLIQVALRMCLLVARMSLF